MPFAICKRGGRKLILALGRAPAASDRPLLDNAMIKALARGFRWRKLLGTGVYGTIEEIAEKERIRVPMGRGLFVTALGT